MTINYWETSLTHDLVAFLMHLSLCYLGTELHLVVQLHLVPVAQSLHLPPTRFIPLAGARTMVFRGDCRRMLWSRPVVSLFDLSWAGSMVMQLELPKHLRPAVNSV